MLDNLKQIWLRLIEMRNIKKPWMKQNHIRKKWNRKVMFVLFGRKD